MEQALLNVSPIMIPQSAIVSKMPEYDIPGEAIGFVEKWVDLSKENDLLIVSSGEELRVWRREEQNGVSAGVSGNIIYMKRLNDLRYINKFMEAVNVNLPMGGCFIGNLETAEQRRNRLLRKYPKYLRMVIYSFDYLIRRVWPKLPYAKKIYFFLTRGKNRVVSEMEAYGRLCSCGFQLLGVFRLENRLYFAARKVDRPQYNTQATYGPVIKLNRHGKNKMIKVYKLRTMYPYSEYLQAYIFEKNGLQSGGKMKNDPRINAVGRFLRRYWLDELPMLINLLKGDLKIFGVRPVSEHYLSLYPKDFQEYRCHFKPGLIPPYYVDLPQTLEEIVESERRYLCAYQQSPFQTDVRYLFKALYNILVKRVRSN